MQPVATKNTSFWLSWAVAFLFTREGQVWQEMQFLPCWCSCLNLCLFPLRLEKTLWDSFTSETVWGSLVSWSFLDILVTLTGSRCHFLDLGLGTVREDTSAFVATWNVIYRHILWFWFFINPSSNVYSLLLCHLCIISLFGQQNIRKMDDLPERS